VIQFGGVTASNPAFISTSQVSCTVPPGTAPGPVSVSVCCNGNCGSASAYSYDSLRFLNQPVAGGIATIQFHVPNTPLRVYQAYGSLGTAGIPLSSWLNGLDQRILPLSYDAVLLWNLHNTPSWFTNFYAQLNAAGTGQGYFQVPTFPQIHGTTFHFAFIVWDPPSQSGVSHVSGQIQATVP
jgi:hypothetical protein